MVAETAISQNVSGQTMLHYYKSWFLIQLDRKEEALAAIREAEQQLPDCCFPNVLEAFLLYNLLSGLRKKHQKPCIIWVICGTTSVSIRKQSPAGRLPCSRMIPSRPSCVIFPWPISIS